MRSKISFYSVSVLIISVFLFSFSACSEPGFDSSSTDLDPEINGDQTGLTEPVLAPPRPDTPFVTEVQALLLREDFENGLADGWALEEGWSVIKDDDNYVLSGKGHHLADPRFRNWTDYTVEVRFKLLEGDANFNFRYTQFPEIGGSERYFINISQGGIALEKQIDSDYFYLTRVQKSISKNDWYDIKIDVDGTTIKVLVDDELVIDYKDDEMPIRSGGISFETTDRSSMYIDNLVVHGVKIIQRSAWIKTGGPSGGLGYDVLIHPLDKNIMFVTDNPSGVNKSYDGGANWVQRNSGITSRSGGSMDGIPIFCLTIDPSNPDIVWAGTQAMRGIYKSVDGGETWSKKDNGIAEWNDITIRGFGVHPQNSDIVFAGAEIETELFGSMFTKVKGKIYKTEDGGESWHCVWEGDNLVRFVLINPVNPDIIYASTGIFDREAYNDEGIGVLRSSDGGKTWKQVNNGIDNLFIGYLEMHPFNPDILYAAAGHCLEQWQLGSIYRTEDGGDNWVKVLGGEWGFGGDRFSAVTVSPADPNVVYVAGDCFFFRSEDGGNSWNMHTKVEGRPFWGPPGLKSGQPIGIVADPDDPMTVYVNSYSGGVFKSTDGGRTWVDWSKGYTGVDMYVVAAFPENPDIVYGSSRSGISGSTDGGKYWHGLIYPEFAGFEEVTAFAVNPQNPMELIAGEAQHTRLFRSSDGGKNWSQVYLHPEMPGLENPESGNHELWHLYSSIVYAPSNPDIVYAGYRKAGASLIVYYESSFGLIKSENGGITWRDINSGLENTGKNINCIAVYSQDPNIAYIGTLQDGVYKTTDGGESWVPLNIGLMSLDIRSLAIDPYNPDIVYAGLGDGAGIYKTSDGGQLWEGINHGIRVECPSYLQRVGEVSPGMSLNLPVRIAGGDYYSLPWSSIESIVIDPVDTQTLYAADLYLGVYMSTDGGENWIAINDGLTTRAVKSLSLSADGWILYAATSGEGVFRLQLW